MTFIDPRTDFIDVLLQKASGPRSIGRWKPESGEDGPCPAEEGAVREEVGADSFQRRRDAARRLASEMRRVIEKLVIVDAPADELERAADAAAAFADRLEGMRQRRWYEGFAEAANAGSPSAFFDHSPIIGLANPLAPPIAIELVNRDEEFSGKDGEGEGGDGIGPFDFATGGLRSKVVGRVRYGYAYEGPPGCVHGGILAAAFDEVLGFAQSLSGKPGMTGTLQIRYRRPTPLNTDLVFEGWVEKIEGRKIFTVGHCKAKDEVTAEAEGLFISVDFEKMAQLLKDRQSRDSAQLGGSGSEGRPT